MAMRNGWHVSFTTADSVVAALDPWELLRLNAGFEGSTRFAIGPRGGLQMCSDTFVDGHEPDELLHSPSIEGTGPATSFSLAEVVRVATEGGWPQVGREGSAELALDRNDRHLR